MLWIDQSGPPCRRAFARPEETVSNVPTNPDQPEQPEPDDTDQDGVDTDTEDAEADRSA